MKRKMRSLVAEALSGSGRRETLHRARAGQIADVRQWRLKGGSFNTEQGFGLRAVAGEAVGYAHAGDLSVSALKRAADAVGAVTRGYSGSYAAAPQALPTEALQRREPDQLATFEEKVKVLGHRRLSARQGRQGPAGDGFGHASWQVVGILRADGHRVRDIRPMTRIISVMVGQGDRQESGSYGSGGRITAGDFIAEGNWQYGADEARLRQASRRSRGDRRARGAMDVVLSSGWPGVMLHEAVGHGLEGDFNRKKTSAFAGLLGQMVAAPASPWSTTARSTAAAARSPSTTRARLRATTC